MTAPPDNKYLRKYQFSRWVLLFLVGETEVNQTAYFTSYLFSNAAVISAREAL
ncbi:hypothetical protein H6G41_31500 [Tolypothrix sp. FACHB-123]|uniref:hypothetical protein n=1 Tax=Tolypothrix sp. FACHB-123 TaxID=2692868 RepID=UPI001684A5CF|nr:hypothetical protein [Tolypothrix sp. FACHB-123]MBD2359063.1 hypothetical protein [Tolypothrix sp. FACHB-123]